MDITNYLKRQKVSVFTQININRSIYEEANIRSRHSIGYKTRVTGRFLQPQQHFKVLMKYAQRSTEMHFFIIKFSRNLKADRLFYLLPFFGLIILIIQAFI